MESIGDRMRRAAELRQLADKAYRLADGSNPDMAVQLRRTAGELEQEAEALEHAEKPDEPASRD